MGLLHCRSPTPHRAGLCIKAEVPNALDLYVTMVEPVNQQEGDRVNAATFDGFRVPPSQDQQPEVCFPHAIGSAALVLPQSRTRRAGVPSPYATVALPLTDFHCANTATIYASSYADSECCWCYLSDNMWHEGVLTVHCTDVFRSIRSPSMPGGCHTSACQEKTA